MTPAFAGQMILLLTTLAIVAAIIVNVIAGLRAEPAYATLGRTLVVWAAVGACTSGVLLAIALMRGTTSMKYVAERYSHDLPTFYKLTSFWSGQQGSLLLWLIVLLICATVMRGLRDRDSGFTDSSDANASSETSVSDNLRGAISTHAWALAVIMIIALFFSILVTFVARPFEPATAATQASGMSPALQNYWMAIHPPTLYLGYIGISVPFALVIGAVIARRVDDRWITLVRRFTLYAWIFLTLGLVFGARWAYEEIGWGGYWAWDPVENAALMPWLTLTAFLHSIMVQTKLSMMRFWNVVLISLTFALSIFGTFLTRSGILSSVHSFVESSIGLWFVSFLALVIVSLLALLYSRRRNLRSHNDLQSVVSREAVFLFNNLLLVSIALMVLWGVLYPILSEAFGSTKVSLQAPYYNFFLVLFGVPLLILMGIGTLVSWRKMQMRTLLSSLAIPTTAAFIVGVVVIVVWDTTNWAILSSLGSAAFVGASVMLSVKRSRGTFRRQRKRYGAYIVHGGVALLVVGMTGSSAFTHEQSRQMTPGDTITNRSYTLEYTDTSRVQRDGAMQVRAAFRVSRNGDDLGTLHAGRNFYPASGEISNEVAIRHHWRTGEDLFVIVEGLQENGQAEVRVMINPLVNLLWFATLVMVCGAGLAAWPRRAESAISEPLESGIPAMDNESAARVQHV